MAPKRKKSIERKPIPEEFELSDDEPTTIKLDEDQKVSSKFITCDCPIYHGKLQLRNETEISPKGVKCKCNPCSFKISKSDKTMNVSRDVMVIFNWTVKTIASLSVLTARLHQKIKKSRKHE